MLTNSPIRPGPLHFTEPSGVLWQLTELGASDAAEA